MTTAAARDLDDDREVVWAAFPGSQSAFLSCPFWEILYDGERGPGKSDAMLMKFYQHVGLGHGPAWRGVIFRRFYPELAELVEKSKALFNRIAPEARFREGGPRGYTWEFPAGEFLRFRFVPNLDAARAYLSHEYPFIGFEELVTWPDPGPYEALIGCNRSSRAGLPRFYVSNTNSYGPGHGWVKRRFVDVGPAYTPHLSMEAKQPDGSVEKLYRVRITGYLEENLFLAANDPTYRAKLEALSDPDLRRSWIGGRDIWNINAGGIVAALWNESRLVLRPEQQFKIPRSWYVDRSFDWGSSAPFSVGWWAEADGSEVTCRDGSTLMPPKGSLVLVDEWYGWSGEPNAGLELETDDISQGILDREQGLRAAVIEGRVRPGPADTQIWITDPDHKADSIADRMKRKGVRWTRANKAPGSRVLRAKAIRDRLAAANKRDPEKPWLLFFETQGTRAGALRTFPELQRDKKNPDDADTNGEDHSWDMAGYRVLARKAGTLSAHEGNL